MISAAWFSAMHPEVEVRFLNRGIKGNRVKDLRNRWQKDCLDLRPSIVTVLIGINDALRPYIWKSPTSAKSFEVDYRRILEQTRSVLNAQIILLEPFALTVNKGQFKLREDLNPKIEVVRRLSREFETLLVPLDEIFAEATRRREPSFWSEDGVHPTSAGHALIAQSWLEKATSCLV